MHGLRRIRPNARRRLNNTFDAICPYAQPLRRYRWGDTGTQTMAERGRQPDLTATAISGGKHTIRPPHSLLKTDAAAALRWNRTPSSVPIFAPRAKQPRPPIHTRIDAARQCCRCPSLFPQPLGAAISERTNTTRSDRWRRRYGQSPKTTGSDSSIFWRGLRKWMDPWRIPQWSDRARLYHEKDRLRSAYQSAIPLYAGDFGEHAGPREPKLRRLG